MRKEGERLVIEPVAPQSLLALLKALKPIDEDFAPTPDPAPEPVDRRRQKIGAGLVRT